MFKRFKLVVLMDFVSVFVCAVLFGLTVFAEVGGAVGFVLFVVGGCLMFVFSCDLMRVAYRVSE